FSAGTLDSDSSPSDVLLALAPGTARVRGAPAISRAGDRRLDDFRRAFRQVLNSLAEQIARDGEGASKLIEVIVEGATSKRSARRIAWSIANSPLVKTAVAGEDANWGRVVMAVGKAGEPADPAPPSSWVNGIRGAHKGLRDPRYDEAKGAAAMQAPPRPLPGGSRLRRRRD